MAISLDVIQSSNNLTVNLSEAELQDIGMQVIRGHKIDEESRKEWKEIIEESMKIAKQLIENKDTPWEGASNVKLPLITMACIDYVARTLPEIMPPGNIVKGKIYGRDPTGEILNRSNRVTRAMTYQLVDESTDWEVNMDKLLQVVSIVGIAFKKTYYSIEEDRNISELCLPDRIVVNNNIMSLESARRITHTIQLYTNDIVMKQRQGLYNEDVDTESLRSISGISEDEDFPIDLLEQHCWLDLDEDGYKEPYIVIVHKDSGQVLRIVSRIKKITKNKAGKIIKIFPELFFNDYHFIHAFDGTYYSLGLGPLLLHMNSTANTLVNQLVNSGTLNSLQGGFIGKGIRLRQGEFKIKMGQWLQLDSATGVDLSKNIFPIPTKEPSQVLFNLLGLIVQMCKDLSSSTDIMKGNLPAQNVAMGTANILLEQGVTMFKAINKRIYRSLKGDYKRIYSLNYEFLSDKKYREILNEPNASVKADFNEDNYDICPVADPTISSMSQRLSKAQVFSSLPTLDRRAIDRYILRSMQLDKEEIDELQPPIDPNNPPPPPPDVQETMAKITKINAEIQQMQEAMLSDRASQALEADKLRQEINESKSRIYESSGRVWKMQRDDLRNAQRLETVREKMMSEQTLKHTNSAHSQTMDGVNANLDAAQLNLEDKKIAKDTLLGLAKLEKENNENTNDSSKESIAEDKAD